ncbi:hypothetical protein TWF281_006167 [Arthrobotrys megalospora]
MRPASIKQIVPPLLLFLLAVNALPSGERRDEGNPEPKAEIEPDRSDVNAVTNRFSKAVDDLLKDIGNVKAGGPSKPVQARDINGAATFHAFEIDKRSLDEKVADSLPSHTALNPRVPDIELADKGDPRPDELEKRDAEPDIAKEVPKISKRSSESQEMKAKLRSRAEKEEYERAKRQWEIRAAHNKKVRHHNMKRLFQHGSPFQEYHNTVPASAFAADDGSFGHSLPGKRRSLPDEKRKLQKRSQSVPPTDEEFTRRSNLISRLQELGYMPEADTASGGSSDGTPGKRKQSEVPESEPIKRGLTPKHKPIKRDINQHIACPGLGLMSSMGNTFINAGTYYWDISAFRDSCFNCGCRAKDGGFFMGPRREAGCTKRLVENCLLAGCRCLSAYGSSNQFLVPKPTWIPQEKSDPATYAIDIYNPQTKSTYSDNYAAEAHIDEVTLGGKVKRHLQSPNLSGASHVFHPNKRNNINRVGEERKIAF